MSEVRTTEKKREKNEKNCTALLGKCEEREAAGQRSDFLVVALPRSVSGVRLGSPEKCGDALSMSALSCSSGSSYS